MAVSSQKSGKNKKYGRNRKQQGAIRYKAENRCAKNKAKKAARHNKRMFLQQTKQMRVLRGTQRRKNRIASGATK